MKATVRALIRRASGAILILCASGCATQRPPLMLFVVRSAVSPDRQKTAYLVGRNTITALDNDHYFVLILPATVPADSAHIANNLDRAALKATRALELKLAWQGDSVLTISCDDCGMEQLDVARRRDRVDSVRLLYDGVPKRRSFIYGDW